MPPAGRNARGEAGCQGQARRGPEKKKARSAGTQPTKNTKCSTSDLAFSYRTVSKQFPPKHWPASKQNRQTFEKRAIAMPDVDEVVNRGPNRYDSAHDAHPPGLGTSRRESRSVWSGRTRNPRVPRKPEPGQAEVANSDRCEARSRIDGCTHRVARTSSRSRRSCSDQVRRRFPCPRRNNIPQLRQRKRLAPREFPLLRLPEPSRGDTRSE